MLMVVVVLVPPKERDERKKSCTFTSRRERIIPEKGNFSRKQNSRWLAEIGGEVRKPRKGRGRGERNESRVVCEKRRSLTRHELGGISLNFKKKFKFKFDLVAHCFGRISSILFWSHEKAVQETLATRFVNRVFLFLVLCLSAQRPLCSKKIMGLYC